MYVFLSSLPSSTHPPTTGLNCRHDEELFLSYGDDKDNHCLLTTYGFVERGNPNPVQIAITTDGGEEDEQQPPPLPSSLPPPTPKQRALLQRLGADDALDASAEWPPLMVGGAPPDDALARALAARVVLATPATASTAFPAALEGAALAKAVLAAAPRAERARVLDGARQALEARLRAYDTAAEEDEVELEGVGKGENAGDAVGGLRASALVLRIEEKEALAAAAAWVDAQSRK